MTLTEIKAQIKALLAAVEEMERREIWGAPIRFTEQWKHVARAGDRVDIENGAVWINGFRTQRISENSYDVFKREGQSERFAGHFGLTADGGWRADPAHGRGVYLTAQEAFDVITGNAPPQGVVGPIRVGERFMWWQDHLNPTPITVTQEWDREFIRFQLDLAPWHDGVRLTEDEFRAQCVRAR